MMNVNHSLSRILNDTGQVTHIMCCICFNVTPVSEVFVDHEGQKWDLCNSVCAAKAGVR
jgi:hypothetical protein